MSNDSLLGFLPPEILTCGRVGRWGRKGWGAAYFSFERETIQIPLSVCHFLKSFRRSAYPQSSLLEGQFY